MSEDGYKILGRSSQKEHSFREEFYELFKSCPIPDNELLTNLGLFINRQTLSRIFFMNHLYEQIINVHGVVMELGVRWGQNLALFESFRGMYEPFNYNRRIIGFDTFEGFKSIHAKDGTGLSVGGYSVPKNYENYLQKILDYHEKESPISHIKKYELIKGDATKTLETFLKDNPETIIALAYFDFDLYEPTKKCLEVIKNHLTIGSILGFDELNVRVFPGETIALKEVLGLNRFRIRRVPFSPLQSYMVVE